MATTKKTNVKKPVVITRPQRGPEEVKAGEICLPLPHKFDQRVNLTSLSVDSTRRILMPLISMLRDGELTVSDDSSTRMLTTAVEMTDRKKELHVTKDRMADLYYSFSQDLTNILATAKADKRYDDAWRRLITNFGVESTSLKSELGRDPEMTVSYGWNREVVPDVMFFPVVVLGARQWWNRHISDYEIYGTLSLRAKDRKTLSDLFFGKESTSARLSASLPEGSGLLTENFEHATVTDILTLDGVALNGSLLAANGSISTVAVKKVKGKTTIGNFTHLPGKWPADRVEMLCLTYFTYLDYTKTKSGVDIKKLAKFAVNTMPDLLTGPIFNTFMPAWQGFTRSWTAETYADDLTEAVYSIITVARKEWLNLDNFRMQLMCSDIEDGYEDMRHLYLFPYYKGREKASLVRKIDKENDGKKGWKIKDIDWFEEIGFRFAVHWIKYLCALGMLELAVDPAADEEDPMEGLRYARLTALGRYAFEIDREYTPKAAEGDTGVEFDAQNGIITIAADSPFQMFLGNVAKKISPTRFRISSETLLKGCRWKAELENRIKNLQVILDPEKEPELKKMIDTALSHTDCAEREGGYSLLKLRPDLPGLREILISDKELREMTILAGPALALVKTSKMDRFNTILASHGYLME